MRVLVLAAIGLLGIGLYVVLQLRDGDPVAVPPPIAPAGSSPVGLTIPPGFLMADTHSTRPLTEEGLRWERAEGLDLPPLINPCGGTLPSETSRVGARQVALVADIRWKLERVVVYRDADAARAAMAERRSALTTCADHPESGVSTRWRFENLDIGEEAMFVAGQRHDGDQGLPGHYRAILMRQGRTVVMFVDFGQARVLADRSEVAPYERDAATMADKLRSAPWN